MGMLEELLRQLQEAAEQKQRTTLPGQSAPRQPARPHPVDEAQRRAREARREAQQAAAEDEADPGESRTKRMVADTTVESPVRRTHPLLARLRAPGGARDAVVLSEILRPRFPRR